MNSFRLYTPSDFITVARWCAANNTLPPPASVFSDSSFIAEIDGVPALFMSLYLTNSKDVAYSDNLIGNPELKGPARREATKELFEHVDAYAKKNGYSNIVSVVPNGKLIDYYCNIGYKAVDTNFTRIMRDL